jgi:hypothetical protein
MGSNPFGFPRDATRPHSTERVFMSDLDDLVQFTLTGWESAMVADTADAGSDLDAVGVRVSVTITARPEVVHLTTTPPRTARIRPVKVRIDNGVLVLTGGVAGDIRLVADSEVLGLDGHLLYDVRFGTGVIAGEQVSFADQNFTFAAPTSDTVVDMSTVERLSGNTPAGTQLRMVPDHVRLNDAGQMVLSSNGIDLPDPLDIEVSGGGGGGGTVDAVVAGTNIDIDATDPAHPIISVESLTADDFTDGTTNKSFTAAEKTKLAAITGTNTGDQNLSSYATTAAVAAGYQPLDADLTALAALTAPATKLTGIAAGATVNDTDANLKSRANHTGTQTASTISDFSTAADARIAASTKVNGSVNGTATALTLWTGSQANYDAIGSPSSTTVYVVI